MIKKIEEAKVYIKAKINNYPKIGLILGSGLGSLGDEIQDAIIIDYKDIPHFPISTVEGHEGKLIVGKLEGKNVVAMQGRFHYYEGYSMQEVTFPVRVMKALGVEILLATNAAGGIREDLGPGNLMIITDHINMAGDNPLIGPNDSKLGVRFPDMSEAYDKELINIAKKVAKEENIYVTTGVYSHISGPTYSTKAELKMLLTIGSDALGMSTVPEVVVANHSGMRVLGISCITDSANPYRMVPPNHEEIVKVANETRPKFIKLMKGIIKKI